MVECVITSPTLRKADRYEKRRQRKNVVNKWKLVQLENAGSDRLSPKFEYRALPLPFATPVAAQETCIQIVLGAYFIDGLKPGVDESTSSTPPAEGRDHAAACEVLRNEVRIRSLNFEGCSSWGIIRH